MTLAMPQFLGLSMVRAEITPVTDNCRDHPDDDFVRRCLSFTFLISLPYYLMAILYFVYYVRLRLSHPYPLQQDWPSL